MNNSDKVYITMIQDSIKSLTKKIEELEVKNNGVRSILDSTTVKINGLKLEVQQLAQELKNYESRMNLSEKKEEKLDNLDEKATKILNKVATHEEKIKELQQLKNNLKTARAKRKIDKQIEHQQTIIRLLQKANTTIDIRQKVIMLPKYYVTKKKDRLLNIAKARVNLNAEKMEDLNMMKKALNENSIIDQVKSVIYDIKGVYYLKRFNYSKEVLARMKNSNSMVNLYGANAITLGKKAINKLRKKSEKKEETALDLVNENENKGQEPLLPVVVR